MNYKVYLRSEDWKYKRKKKNPRRCGICASEKNLDIHHLNYKNLYDVEMSDLRVLCRRCHFLCHDLYKQGKFKFTTNDHNSRWCYIKNAVKKELKITNVNMFYPQNKE